MNFSISARSIKTATIVLTALILSLALIRSAMANDLSNWRVVQIPGATSVEVAGINNSGQVAGTYSAPGAPGDSPEHGFIRNPNGSITTIDVNALAGTAIYGLNNKGQVVGYSDGAGFIRNPNGTVVTFTYPPGTETSLEGINDLGQVVGEGGQGAFMTTVDGRFVLLPPGLGTPNGINNAGQVVALARQQSGYGLGAVLNTDGAVTTFVVPGSVGTIATGINNLGQIIGYYGFIPPQYPDQTQLRGFIRDTDGTITTFDAPLFGSTQPNGIADNGTIAASFTRNGDGLPPNMGLFRKCILCP